VTAPVPEQSQSQDSSVPGRNTIPEVSLLQYMWFFAALPAGAAVFPALVEAAQAATEQVRCAEFVVLALSTSLVLCTLLASGIRR
jgi:hypothetical protein